MKYASLLLIILVIRSSGEILPDALACSQIERCRALVRTPDGTVYVAGGTGGEVFLKRIFPGATEPDRTTYFTNGKGLVVEAVVRDRDGMLVLGGSSFQGGLLWRVDPATARITAAAPALTLGNRIAALALDSSGDLFAGGNSPLRGFLAHVHPTKLMPLWMTEVDPVPYAIAVTPSGHLAALTGNSSLLQLKAGDGAVEWTRNIADVRR